MSIDDENDVTSDKNARPPALLVEGELVDLEKIGMGGMAHIYRAKQPSLDRYVAIKRLKEELRNSPETVERFRREARALASVLHHNIAHVYDFVEGERESYIVMEYIDGFDLSTIIKKTGNVPTDVAACILLNVAKGIDHLHAHHLVHRDLKPSNIRVTAKGGVKVMDFGIVVDVQDKGLTRTGIMVGSPNYLSPEQVIGDPITPKSDLFLLGITFYEMLTGVKPFKEQGGETVYQRIREAKYLPAKEMYGYIPTALDHIVSRCLKRKPEDRYKSVKGLIYDLEAFLGPVKSAHSEDILLEFLDDEGFLTLSSKQGDIQDQTHKGYKYPPKWMLSATAMVMAAFLSGFGVSGLYWKSKLVPKKGFGPFPPPTALQTTQGRNVQSVKKK